MYYECLSMQILAAGGRLFARLFSCSWPCIVVAFLLRGISTIRFDNVVRFNCHLCHYAIVRCLCARHILACAVRVKYFANCMVCTWNKGRGVGRT